jgi:hypothetical protein
MTEHEDVTVFWNQGIQTDIEVPANRPDIAQSDLRSTWARLVGTLKLDVRNILMT